MSERMTRRELLRFVGIGGTAVLLAACQPEVVEKIVKETVEVEKIVKEVVKETVIVAGTPQVVEKEITRIVEKMVMPATPEPVTIQYWHPWSGVFADLVDRLAADFHNDNEHITITVTRIAGMAQLMQKMLPSVAAGSPPDGFMIFNGEGSIYTLADLEAILPLEAVATPDDLEVYEELVHPALYAIGEYQGKVYGVPQWTQMYMLYYNRTLVEEAGLDPEKPPKTFADLDEYAHKLYELDDKGNITRIGLRPGWLRPYMAQFDGTWLDGEGNIAANHPNNLQMLEWAMGYSKRYDYVKIEEFRTAVAAAGNLFVMGNEAILRSGPWVLGTIKDTRPDMDFGLWHMPEPLDHPGFGVYTYGDIPLIPKGSPHPDVAWMWLQYLTGVANPGAYADLWIIGRRPHMPVSKKVADSAAFDKVRAMFPRFEKFLARYWTADRYVYPPKIPIADFYIRRFDSWCQTALLQEVTPEEALDSCQDEVTKEWQKYQERKA